MCIDPGLGETVRDKVPDLMEFLLVSALFFIVEGTARDPKKGAICL